MKETDIKLLELLLSQLYVELGCKFCIVPQYIQDGVCIITYDDDGEIKNQEIGTDINSVIQKLKNKGTK